MGLCKVLISSLFPLQCFPLLQRRKNTGKCVRWGSQVSCNGTELLSGTPGLVDLVPDQRPRCKIWKHPLSPSSGHFLTSSSLSFWKGASMQNFISQMEGFLWSGSQGRSSLNSYQQVAAIHMLPLFSGAYFPPGSILGAEGMMGKGISKRKIKERNMTFRIQCL